MGRNRKESALGKSLLATWLYEEEWTQDSVAMYLEISRAYVRKYLTHPHKWMSVQQLMMLNLMLPEKSFADIINVITRAPISSNIFVEDEFLITPRMKKRQWMDD
jgi:predicted transcriptional regulator